MDLKNIYKLNILSKHIIWAVDSVLSLFAFAFSYLLFHALVDFDVDVNRSLHTLLVVALVSVGVTWVCKTYKGIIRHTSVIEMTRIVYSMLLKSASLLLLAFIFEDYVGLFVCSLLFADFILSVFLLMSTRVFIVNFYYFLLSKSDKKEGNTLIYGTSEAAVSLANYLRGAEDENYRITGFITRDASLRNYRIQGYPVYYFPENVDLESQLKHLDIETILFTNNAELHKDEALINYGIQHHIVLRIAPLIEGKDDISRRVQMREVQIEDLLERDEITVDMKALAEQLRGKSIIVTGAAGSIGSELCRQLCNFDFKQLILFDFSETATYRIDMELRMKYPTKKVIPVIGDIRNRQSVELALKKYKPTLLFHAAAYKHVPMMESYPCEAVTNNVGGTRNVAEAAVACGIQKFIMISSDKAVRPSNVMGATKRLAEMYVQSLGKAIKEGKIKGKTQFVTTRFGNVLGSNGSVIPLFREQILTGGPVTVTHPEIIRYFMTIPEACRLVLEAAFLGQGNDIFVFDMGNPVKIDNLARKMIQIAGLRPDKDIKIVYTGLRPGEKLYEELLNQKENTLPTQNKKIFRAKSIDLIYADLVPQIEVLLNTARTNNDAETVKAMKCIAKDFVSQHSIYSALDHNK